MAGNFIEMNYNTLRNMFPNAEPQYLESIAIECEYNEADLQRYIEQMLAPNASYPTIGEQITRKKNEDIIASYTNSFNVEEYLRKFPNSNPREYFSTVKTENERGKTHADHSLQYLAEAFPHLTMETIEKSLKKHKYCLVNTMFALRKCKGQPSCRCSHHGQMQRRRCAKRKEVDSINTEFLDEVAYIEHEEEIEDYISTMAIFRDMKFEEAKQVGMLCQCECCFDTDTMVDETFACTQGHLFCESCLEKQCKKESHTPYECDYLEKSNDRCRKYVEDRLSEALIRECYKCHRKYVKENSGCNHITCPHCQSHMCYVCRQPLDSSRIGEHFAGQGSTNRRKCPLFSDPNLLHVEAIENVGQAVVKELRRTDPTAQIEITDYLPENIRGSGKVLGAPEQKDIVLRHTMKAAGLN
uniref:E3 ubiquitin-protein ligase RNF216 n=1 Tax=Cacopsylla melanoneura TaxID=428564 RepID=A0A8D8T6D6_9HEMI